MQSGPVRADNIPMEGVQPDARAESGFTILELIVALTVLAIALFGIASVFDASVRTSDLDIRRTEAVALSVQAVESLRAVPYSTLGLAPSDPSPADACDAGSTVVRASGAPYAAVTSQTVNGVTYAIDRCVVWAQASSGGSTTAYKRVTAAVSWTDQARVAHVVRQDSIVYPGPGGNSSAATACSSDPAAAAAPSASLVGSNTVRLAWNTPSVSPTPIDHWIVLYGPTNPPAATFAGDLNAASPGAANSVVISALAPSTTYSFEVVAVDASGSCVSPSPASSQSTSAASGGGPCRVGLVTATPASVQRGQAGDQSLLSDFRVDVAALTSACDSLTLDYTPSSGAPPVELALSNVSGLAFEVDVFPGDAWDLGNHVLSIENGGAPVGTVGLCVQDQGGSSC